MSKFDPKNQAELNEALDRMMDEHNQQTYTHAAMRQMIKQAAALGWNCAAYVYSKKAAQDLSDAMAVVGDAAQTLKSRGD